VSNENSEMMTVNEVAEYLKMNSMTIYRMAQQGRIPASKILGCWRFSRRDIEAWIKSQEFQPSKILVIDDDPVIGTMIKNALGRKHQVMIANTAQDALNILGQNRFNMIFLDLALPDTDGFTLYKQLKTQENSIPVVVITSSTDANLLTKVVSEGARFVLNKPFTDEEIRQMLNFLKV
jgi:excisionase family DNA binding protein